MKPIHDGPIINNKYYGDRGTPLCINCYAQEVQEAKTTCGLPDVAHLDWGFCAVGKTGVYREEYPIIPIFGAKQTSLK